MSMLQSVVSSNVTTALADYAGIVDEESIATAVRAFEGIYFPKDSLKIEGISKADDLTEAIFEKCAATYEAKEAEYGSQIMRELERVVMLRVVDEFWMDNIDAMDDLKQGIGLRAYGQHDPVIAYKEEGYQMFEAMVQAIKDETIRRMFLVRLAPQQEVKRERVAKETGTGAANNAVIKKQPVRKQVKAGPNDPCPCGSGKKYKKCCMQKEKLGQ